MKYNVLVEMDEHANIDLLVKAMSIMESVPHVTGVSLVGVDAAQKETMHKFKLNKMVASLESMIRDLKNEIYITFDTAIHYLFQRVAGVPYHALSEDKSFSCYYAQERLYLVRKMFGDFPVYMFIEANSSKDATDKAIKALAKHTIDGYIIADHEKEQEKCKHLL